MMSLEEEGAYCRLLWYCWQHGSVPSSPRLAARLIGKRCSVRIARRVLAMFGVPRGDGRVTNDRMEEERAKQEIWRQKSSEGGKRSALARKGASTTLARVVPRVVEKCLEPNVNSPSPSPSPSTEISLSVEPHASFPKTEQEAAEHAAFAGCTSDFAVLTWTKASSRGGRDSKDVQIRHWRHYLKAETEYERGRQNENHARTHSGSTSNSGTKPRRAEPDYSKGF